MTPDTWNWNHAVRRCTTDADQQANCEVRAEEAGTELLRAFEVGIPQYGLQQEDTGSEQKKMRCFVRFLQSSVTAITARNMRLDGTNFLID
jgi:hypothetical protein